MMISCRKATQLLSEGQDRQLSLAERIALRSHLFLCRACRAFERQLELLRRAMRRLLEES